MTALLLLSFSTREEFECWVSAFLTCLHKHDRSLTCICDT